MPNTEERKKKFRIIEIDADIFTKVENLRCGAIGATGKPITKMQWYSKVMAEGLKAMSPKVPDQLCTKHDATITEQIYIQLGLDKLE